MHNSSWVNPSDSGKNCTELVWCHCYIVSDVWCYDGLWEIPSLCFQSCSSEVWYYEKVLASVSLSVTPSEYVFGSFVLRVLEYCTTVWCSAADSHLKLLDSVVRSAWFLVVGVLESNLDHRRSVAVLCMLSRLRVTQCIWWVAHLPLPYVPERVTRCSSAFVGNPLCRTSHYLRTFAPLSVSLWNDFSDPVLHGVGLAVIRAEPMFSCRPNLLFFVYCYFHFFVLPFHGLAVWGRGLRIYRVFSLSLPCGVFSLTISQPYTADSFLIIMTI